MCHVILLTPMNLQRWSMSRSLLEKPRPWMWGVFSKRVAVLPRVSSQERKREKEKVFVLLIREVDGVNTAAA